MTAIPVKRSKFITGDLSTGQLILTRDNGTTAVCGVLMMTGVTVTDNEDGTWTLDLGV